MDSNCNLFYFLGNNVDILSGLSAGGSAPPQQVSPARMPAPASPSRMGGAGEPANNPWDLSALDPMGGGGLMGGGVDLLNGGQVKIFFF